MMIIIILDPSNLGHGQRVVLSNHVSHSVSRLGNCEWNCPLLSTGEHPACCAAVNRDS